MSYTPSEAAVEAPARAIFKADHEDSGRTWDSEDAGTHEWYYGLARAALVALMGATVTEPCANPHHVEDSTYRWLNDLDEFGAPCPDCPAPRSLVVRECEQAGRLRAASRRDAVDYADWIGGSADLFREVPPTEETR